MPMAGITTLQTVNRMLKANNHPPVSSLDVGGSSLVARAQATLDDVDRELQGRGWHFNTELQVEIAKDASGNVPIEGSWSAVRPTTVNATARHADKKLYDLDDQTYTWSSNVEIDRVVRIEFEDTPPMYREWATAMAVVRFQRETKSSSKVDAFFRDEEMKAKGRWEAEDAKEGKYNLFQDSQTMREVMGYSINRGGYQERDRYNAF